MSFENEVKSSIPGGLLESNGNEGHKGSFIDLVWKSLKFLFPEFLVYRGKDRIAPRLPPPAVSCPLCNSDLAPR